MTVEKPKKVDYNDNTEKDWANACCRKNWGRNVNEQGNSKTGYILVRQLKRQIKVFETRYETSSGQMAEALRTGRVKETAEISKWMQSYAVMKWIDQTRTAGTPSKTTSMSTKRD